MKMFGKWKRLVRRSHLLSKQIDLKIKESCHLNRRQDFKDWFSQIYLPSLPSFAIVALLSGIFIWLGHWDIANLPLFATSNDYANLIAVHAGIGVIIFALVIFIAESIRDDTDKDRARVLLKVSLLFPLTVAEIFVFFGFLWGDVNWIMAVAVGAVGVLSVYSISMLLLTLLSPYRFSRYRIALLKDRIKKSISEAIDQRYGNAILFESLGKKIKLSYYPLLHKEDEDTFVVFTSRKLGTIVDIRMDVLERISDIIERKANENGYSFDKNISGAGGDADPSSVTSAGTERYKKDAERYLLKKYKDELDEEERRLICVKKNVLGDNPDIIREIASLVDDAFIIGSARNFSEEILAELDGIEDQFFGAIDAGRLAKVKEFAKAYIALAESFLELLQECGGGYTYEQAKKEASNVWDEWSEMRWLQESVRDLFSKSMATDNADVIREIASLPIAICLRAMKAGDQYLFQKFIRFSEVLYVGSLEKSGNLKNMMVDLSWRYLKKLVDFYIEPPIRDTNDLEEIEKYRDFGLPVFMAFLGLLKQSFEKHDLASAKEFLAAFEDLYDGFDRPRYPDAQQLKWRLEAVTDPVEKAMFEEKLRLEQSREKVQKEIGRRKREMLFGLAGWLFKKYWRTPANPEAKAAFETIDPHLPHDIMGLTETFAADHDHTTAEFWGWSWWDLVADGHVHSMDINGDVERLYAVEALKTLSGMSADQIARVQFSPSRDMAFLAEPTSSLNTLLNDIAGNPGNWHFALSDAAIAQIPNLRTLLKKAKELQEENDKRTIAAASLGPKKIQEFRKSFWDAFNRTATLRNVAEKLGIIKNAPLPEAPAPGEIPSFGFNQVAEKQAFIDDWHVHYAGNGEQYGRGLGYAENDAVLEAVAASAASQEIDKANIYSTIESIIRERKTEMPNPVIFESLGYTDEYDHIKKNENFTDVYHKKAPKTGFENMEGYVGCLIIGDRPIPIVRMSARKGALKNKVIIADLKRLGAWDQYPPTNPDNPIPTEGQFAFRITDLNQDNEMRTKIASQNLAWLQGVEDKDTYLKERVLVFILERFKFRIEHLEAAYQLTPAAEDDGDDEI